MSKYNTFAVNPSIKAVISAESLFVIYYALWTAKKDSDFWGF